MSIFDRHIARRLASGYFFLVGALILFFIVLHYVESIDDFMDRGATMSQVASYYLNYTPEIIRLTSPLALFLSCVYLTGKLSQQLQLAALQTSGVSLYRIMRPYLLVAVLVTAGIFWFNGWIVPRTNQAVLQFEEKYLKDAPRVIETSDIHRQERPGSIVSVGFFDRVNAKGFRVTIEYFDSASHLASRLDASDMQWIDSLSIWRLHSPVIRHFDDDGAETRSVLVTLDTLLNVYPRDLARTERDVETMTIPLAGEYIDELRRSGASGLGRPLVEYYGKFAYPFANLILVMIGMPMAAVRRRGGQAVRLGLGLLVAFAYLAVQKIAEPFGYSGEISPILVAWLPHLIFTTVALFILVRVRK